MTDTNRIDLDELDVSDDADDEPDASRGDWFWQGEGDPDAEPAEPDYDPAESGVSRQMEADAEPVDSTGTTAIDTGEDADGDGVADADADADGDAVADADADSDAVADADADAAVSAEGDADADADGAAESHAAVEDGRGAIPRVPRENDDSPVGVPSDAGGAGSGAGPADALHASSGGGSAAPAGSSAGDGVAGGSDDAAPGTPEGRNPDVGTNEARKAVDAGEAEAKGPHGGGADDMTMAISYNAMTQLSDPQLTVAKAREWADWIGIVGEVEAPVINQFQREHAVDADFFNGTGTGPAERLANIGETSMFYAERMVLVGTPEDEWIAAEAGWEFIPFETAAEKADWERET